jgi:hypothetical protein
VGHIGARYDAIRFRDHTVRQGVLALPIIAPDVKKALFTNKGQAHSAAMMALVIEVEFQIAILPLWVFQNGIQSTGAALGGKTSSIFDEIVVPASEWKILRDKVREALRQIPPRCAGSEAMNDRTPLAGPVRPRRKPLSRSPMLRHTEAQGSRLKAQGSRLKAQGSRLKAKCSRLKAQGSRLKAQGSRLKTSCHPCPVCSPSSATWPVEGPLADTCGQRVRPRCSAQNLRLFGKPNPVTEKTPI